MWKTVRELIEARHGQVLGDGEDRDQAVALAILGDEREAAGDATSDVALAHRLAFDEDEAGRHWMATHDAFQELAAPGAHQSVEADDLAGAHRQRDMVDGVAAGDAGQRDVLGAQRLAAEIVIARRREILGVGADHLADDPLQVDIGHRLRCQ